MTYTLTRNEQTIRRDSDGAFIPMDARNPDYAAYLVWVSEGNTATVPDGDNPVSPPSDPADPPSSAPGI